MINCIFTSHCMELSCDKSCPMLVETSYLLERNGLNLNNPVFYKYPDKIPKILDLLNTDECLRSYKVDSDITTVEAANLITYCAICKYWRGSQLHCTVYNLRFSKYLDELKKSWNTRGESENVEFMQIWSESAKVLIISNFDYVKFGDFESQTMLNLIQSRTSQGLLTILVTPPISNLITGNSSFAAMLIDKIRKVSDTPTKSPKKLGGI